MSLIPPFFFFNDTATTEIYTLSLHDALPISTEPAPGGHAGLSRGGHQEPASGRDRARLARRGASPVDRDRKSTRLNSSHRHISYAVFCLEKKKQPAAPTGNWSSVEYRCCERP